jgi:AraC-like DNA-binding protein
MSIKQELNHKLFMQREENVRHIDYDIEMSLYKAIAQGNKAQIKETRERYRKAVANSERKNSRDGVLSLDPVQNDKYHFVILAAMIARVCMQYGLSHESAYNLSDIYIQKMDGCTSLDQLGALRTDMIYEFADQMQDLKRQNIYSRHIVRCIDYIYDNLNTNLTIGGIARELELNPTYLSKLFAKETGMSLSAYIKEEKLRAAAYMLEYTSFSIGDISEYFCFSSQSHFTNTFQRQYNITPKKYRDLHCKHDIT